MSDSIEVRLGGQEHEYVAIRVYGRKYPQASHDFDSDWLAARIDLRIGGFSASVIAQLRSVDFARFLKGTTSVYEELEGNAKFDTLEDWLSIELTGNGRGQIEAEIEMRDDPSIANKLVAKLHLDRTYLRSTLDGLREVVRRYPVLTPGYMGGS